MTSSSATRPPLAIIGMGHVLPTSRTTDELWRALREARPAFRLPPPGRWDPLVYADPLCAGSERLAPDIVAAFVEDFRFDWRKFRMAPKVAEQLNPMHLLLMHASADALADAEAQGAPLERVRTGFALGTSGLGLRGDYGLRVREVDFLDAVRAALEQAEVPAARQGALLERTREVVGARLLPILEDNVLMAVASVAQGRVMNHFRLQGPHFAVDAGGACSFAALDAAWEWLADGDCDAFLVGGASPWLNPLELVAWSRAGLLGTGPPRPLDVAAQGTALGEGTGVVVVELLSEALCRGHHVRAVLWSLAGETGGRHFRPSPPDASTLRRVFERAYEEAPISPREVGFIECHASGLLREDEDEVSALSQVFGEPGERPPLYLGAVKGLVGHLQGAAGMAGLLKTVLSLEKGELPPERCMAEPLRAVGLAEAAFGGGGPLRVSHGARPWPAGPRVAAVTALGMMGTAYHAVLESFPTARPPPRLAPRAPAASRSVAVVGLGAVLPDAPDVASFWSNMMAGHCAVRDVPPERFDASRYVDPSRQDKARPYSKLGALLSPPAPPDRPRTVVPRALPHVDRAQLVTLAAAGEAVRSAGECLSRVAPGRTLVLIADAPQREKEVDAAGRVDAARMLDALAGVLSEARVESARILPAVRERFCALYTPLTEDTLAGAQGSAISSRVAHELGLRGIAFGLETACASSLAAVALAMKALARGAYDVAVVGGVSASMSPEVLMSVCAFNGISAEAIRPFDERADGFVVGEGAAVLVLERLEDAERGRDRVYAVLRGYGGSSDGEGVSVFPPNPRGQALACRRALDKSGVASGHIDLIECHGTGTPLGDQSEVEAYARVYGGHGKSRPLYLSSLKSMVGHLNAGAGAAGLLRTSLALHHRRLPPTVSSERQSPALPMAAGPFEVIREPRTWPAPPEGRPRRAAVSAFGLGGTNFHLVLEEHCPVVADAPRAAILAPDHSPLLASRRAGGPGQQLFGRRISLATDPYLEDHLVGGVPVVPGAVGCELIAQAASLTAPEMHVVGVEQVRFVQLLRVPPGQGPELEVSCRPGPARGKFQALEVEVASYHAVPARPEHRIRRLHLQGVALLARSPLAAIDVPPALLRLTGRPGRDYAPLYEDHVYSTLGPRFRSIRAAEILEDGSLLARLVALPEHRLFAATQRPRLLLGPMMLDNYFQAAGTLGVYHNHFFPLPRGLGGLRIWERPRPGETVWVHCQLEDEGDETLRYSAQVFDRKGRLRVRLEGFETQNVQPFERAELDKFFRTLTGAPPVLRAR